MNFTMENFTSFSYSSSSTKETNNYLNSLIITKLNTYTTVFDKLITNNSKTQTNDNDIIHDKIDGIVARINLGSMLFGIIGNFICICVLGQKTILNKKFNWYLLMLAFADLIYSFIVFTNYIIVIINPERALYDLSKYTCYFTDYIFRSIDTFCVFLTLVLSIDRLYAITNPIKSKSFFTYRYPKQIALVGYLMLTIVKSPDLFLSQRTYVTPESKAPTTLENEHTMLNIFDGILVNVTQSAYYSTQTDNNYETGFKSESDIVQNIIEEDVELNERPYCQYTTMFDSSNNISDEKHKTRIIYIIYCNVVVPLLFNVLPELIILILNLALWFFMRKYFKISSENGMISNSLRNSIRNPNSKRTMTKSQQSHYFTIIMLGMFDFK